MCIRDRVELGAYSFAWCPNLEIVVFPDSLTTVGKSAFSNCPKIRSITIGASLTDLGEISFTGANNLETLSLIHIFLLSSHHWHNFHCGEQG